MISNKLLNTYHSQLTAIKKTTSYAFQFLKQLLTIHHHEKNLHTSVHRCHRL